MASDLAYSHLSCTIATVAKFIRRCDTLYEDTWQNVMLSEAYLLGAMTLSIAMLFVTTLSITKKRDTQHDDRVLLCCVIYADCWVC
jgi:hypothetical protein